MKRIIKNIAQKMKGTSWYFCQLSKKMVLQINKYIDEQINEIYESIKTGKPKQDRKTKAKLRFFFRYCFYWMCRIIGRDACWKFSISGERSDY